MNASPLFLSISVPLVALLLRLPSTASGPIDLYFRLFINALVFYSLAAIALSCTAEVKWKNPQHVKLALENENQERAGIVTTCSSQSEPNTSLRRYVWTTRCFGVFAGAYILTIPIVHPVSEPLLDCLLRVATFFYGCKILDLAVARAHRPPILLAAKDVPKMGLSKWTGKLVYVTYLTTQTRYSAFDIAVNTARFNSRRAAIPQSKLWLYGPCIVIPLTLIFPFAELKVLSGLVVIHFGLDMVHRVCHGNTCPNPLFCQPFSAPTLSDFWTLHWHQGAQPFLYNLAYMPASRLVRNLGFGKDLSRAAGVLAAFSLSGIWHGWCAVPLSGQGHAWTVATGLWAVFVMQGVGCLAEKLIWGKQQGGWVQRVLVWTYAIEVGAVWMRVADARRVELPWLEHLILQWSSKF